MALFRTAASAFCRTLILPRLSRLPSLILCHLGEPVRIALPALCAALLLAARLLTARLLTARLLAT